MFLTGNKVVFIPSYPPLRRPLKKNMHFVPSNCSNNFNFHIISPARWTSFSYHDICCWVHNFHIVLVALAWEMLNMIRGSEPVGEHATWCTSKPCQVALYRHTWHTAPAAATHHFCQHGSSISELPDLEREEKRKPLKKCKNVLVAEVHNLPRTFNCTPRSCPP